MATKDASRHDQSAPQLTSTMLSNDLVQYAFSSSAAGGCRCGHQDQHGVRISEPLQRRGRMGATVVQPKGWIYQSYVVAFRQA
jgi:hypothetical protein